MPSEPALKRTVAFVDGQNLFHAAREAFGYTYPNYDVRALSERICQDKGWTLTHSLLPPAVLEQFETIQTDLADN